MTSTKEWRKFLRALEMFRTLDPNMSLNSLCVLLMAGDEERYPHQKLIEDRLSLSNAAASRNVSYWSEFKSPGKEGLGMLENYPDPMDRVRRKLRILPKGRSFLNQITDILKET